MKLSIAQGQLKKLTDRLSYTMLLTLFLSISNIILAGFSGYALLHQQRIVTPYNSSRGYVVSDSDVDASYLDLMSIDLMNTRFNQTPESVQANNQWFLQSVDSRYYAKWLQDLNHEASVIQKDKISSAFYRSTLFSDPNTLTTHVTGVLKRWVGYRAIPETKKTYVLHYRYHLGRLWLKGIQELTDEKN